MSSVEFFFELMNLLKILYFEKLIFYYIEIYGMIFFSNEWKILLVFMVNFIELIFLMGFES